MTISSFVILTACAVLFKGIYSSRRAHVRSPNPSWLYCSFVLWFQFNPSLPISSEITGFKKNTTLKDRIHCVCIVIDGSSAGALPEKMLEKIKSMQPKIHVRGNNINFWKILHLRIQRRGQVSRHPPPGKLQKYRVPYQYWSGSPKITKLPIQYSMPGQHRPSSKTQF